MNIENLKDNFSRDGDDNFLYDRYYEDKNLQMFNYPLKGGNKHD